MKKTVYYAKSTGGFYHSDIHTKDKIPTDAIEITDERRHELLAAEVAGKAIVADEQGIPQIGERVITEAEKKSILIGEARTALVISDRVILRFMERNISVPAAWAEYRDALRLIASGASSATELPEKPPYD